MNSKNKCESPCRSLTLTLILSQKMFSHIHVHGVGTLHLHLPFKYISHIQICFLLRLGLGRVLLHPMIKQKVSWSHIRCTNDETGVQMKTKMARIIQTHPYKSHYLYQLKAMPMFQLALEISAIVINDSVESYIKSDQLLHR